MSTFWTLWIAIITIGNVVACWWLIWYTSRTKPNEVVDGEVTNHVWDEDLQERNSPLPRWWLNLFHITIVFTLTYVLLYPAIGKGLLGWSSTDQYEEEIEVAEATYGPIYAQYAGQDVATLAQDPKAVDLGHAVFINNCTTCHGSDARGARGFPNLADADWQWGGAPDRILQTISNGRNAAMPPFGPILGEEGVAQVVEYVRSLSGLDADAAMVEAGKPTFMGNCAMCHGAGGEGNPLLGAPNLADATWLYGSDRKVITQTVSKGRNGMMPAHAPLLGEDKVRLVAAYVYQLGSDGARSSDASDGARAPEKVAQTGSAGNGSR